MIRHLFLKYTDAVSQFLQNPVKVLVVCLCLLSISLLLDGSLLHLWQLDRDAKELATRMTRVRSESVELEKKITRARDPNFIELQAREKFELANEGDLVFVFSDEQ